MASASDSPIPAGSSENDLIAARAEKLAKISALGRDPWGGRFDGVQAIDVVRQLNPAADPPIKTCVAGRIILRRTMGNLHFLTIQDVSGRIQIGLNRKLLPEADWQLAQLLDLGDLIGAKGNFGTTKTGELTVWADELHFLTKSLLPHPDKLSGMQDIEFRLRHRYLDLTYTPEILDIAKKRIQIIRTIRNHLDGQGFFEVETPIFHAIAGGAAARPFITHHNTLDIDLYLRIALELPLKRLLVGGMERVYEIGRVFRNEGISHKHNPEFTMMELYQAYGDYRTMMELTEGMILAAIDAIGGGRVRPWGDKTVDFNPPWQRAKYGDLFQEHVGVAMSDEAGVKAAADNVGIPTTGKEHDVIVNDLFERKVEDHLTGPVFVYDYPAALCPLTKRQTANPQIAERFELYVHGMELANAYTELNDPDTQEATFKRQLSGLKEEDSMAKMDDDFIKALRYGMPPAGGLGVGIDRLVMLLTNTPTIRDVILFPLLRPEAK